ncbi:MAG TPA: hypothetical protein VF063_10625 [Gaiellaceae bacterium]
MCGSAGKLDLTEKPPGSHPAWWVQCWVCPNGREYTAALRDAVGVAASLILDDPLRYLAAWLTTNGHRRSAPQPPPTEATVDGWRSGLLASPDGLRYLIQERGLTLETIKRYELGYDQDHHAVTFPVRDEDGALVNVRRRRLNPNARPKIVGLARPASIYPLGILADDPAALVICEGELDCLLLNQHGIPALTGTAGTTWKDEWSAYIVGRQVAVMYDAGSHELATRRASGLRAAGARDAWPVDLSRAGLEHGEDVGDWFVTYGRSARELRRFINGSRRCRREATHGD